MKIKTLTESPNASFRTKAKIDIKLKSGELIPRGAEVECIFSDDILTRFLIKAANLEKSVRVPYRSANKYLIGFTAQPGMSSLERMMNDGIVTTPLGSRTEPDGYGQYGEPSWLLVLGLI